jgi:hypothetical protein
MDPLTTLPIEILEQIIDVLVVNVGIYKAVLLRTVCSGYLFGLPLKKAKAYIHFRLFQ